MISGDVSVNVNGRIVVVVEVIVVVEFIVVIVSVVESKVVDESVVVDRVRRRVVDVYTSASFSGSPGWKNFAAACLDFDG